MTRYRTQFSPKARRHLQEIAAWAKEHRASPDLLLAELNAAIASLNDTPGVGVRHIGGSILGMRRLLVPRWNYLVYYTVDEAEAVVRIYAVWHSARGKGPPL